MAEEFKKVTSLEQLHEILKKGTSEFFVQLNYGVRSWKTIGYADENDCNGNSKFEILNEIDESRQVLTEKNLFNDRFTVIGRAINEGSFYYAWT